MHGLIRAAVSGALEGEMGERRGTARVAAFSQCHMLRSRAVLTDGFGLFQAGYPEGTCIASKARVFFCGPRCCDCWVRRHFYFEDDIFLATRRGLVDRRPQPSLVLDVDDAVLANFASTSLPRRFSLTLHFDTMLAGWRVQCALLACMRRTSAVHGLEALPP